MPGRMVWARLLSFQVGHCRRAHVTGLRRGQIRRQILGMKKTVNSEMPTELARVLAPREFDRYLSCNLVAIYQISPLSF